MNLKIVNAELGIASCSRDQVAEDIQNPSTVIFFYYQKRDWIVFNEDHPDYELYLELVQGYMGLDEEEKVAFLKLVDVDKVRKPLEVVDRILRIRKETLVDMQGGGTKETPGAATPRESGSRAGARKEIYTLIIHRGQEDCKMNKEFNKLSSEAQARIRIRNGCQDALIEPEISIDKADFLVRMIQENHMSLAVDNEESLFKWEFEKPRIEKLLDMIGDYTLKALDALRALDKQLKEDTEADYRGGELEDGRS